MILHPFSWQELLVAALVCSVLWYTGLMLLFYRKHLTAFFSSRVSPDVARSSVPERHKVLGPGSIRQEEAPTAEQNAESLMGKRRLPQGMSVISAEQLRFAGVEAVTSI